MSEHGYVSIQAPHRDIAEFAGELGRRQLPVAKKRFYDAQSHRMQQQVSAPPRSHPSTTIHISAIIHAPMTNGSTEPGLAGDSMATMSARNAGVRSARDSQSTRERRSQGLNLP